MKCPRCKTLLHKEKLSDRTNTIVVENCFECGGIWFEKGELEQIEHIMEPVLVEIRRIPNTEKQMIPLICPQCGGMQAMDKYHHPRDEKVVVDTCPNCQGIWLDKGELEAIQKENWLITMRKLLYWLVVGE